MNIRIYKTVDEARELLSGTEDRIVTKLQPAEILKRARWIKAGAFDFDQSLAIGNQWLEIESIVGSHYIQGEQSDREWYLERAHANHTNHKGPIEDTDWFFEKTVLDNRAAVEGAWVARSVKRFEQQAVMDSTFAHIGKHMTLRDGARDLFALLEKRLVISMGIEQLIAASLQHNGMSAGVIATRLVFNKENTVSGCHRNVVVSTSKGVAHRRFVELSEMRVKHHLVLGDSYFDIHMMPQGAFNVWIVPHSDVDNGLVNYRDAHFEIMLDRATIVLYSNSLLPLVMLIREARAGM